MLDLSRNIQHMLDDMCIDVFYGFHIEEDRVTLYNKLHPNHYVVFRIVREPEYTLILKLKNVGIPHKFAGLLRENLLYELDPDYDSENDDPIPIFSEPLEQQSSEDPRVCI
jgi:hypothetical protein